MKFKHILNESADYKKFGKMIEKKGDKFGMVADNRLQASFEDWDSAWDFLERDADNFIDADEFEESSADDCIIDVYGKVLAYLGVSGNRVYAYEI